MKKCYAVVDPTAPSDTEVKDRGHRVRIGARVHREDGGERIGGREREGFSEGRIRRL